MSPCPVRDADHQCVPQAPEHSVPLLTQLLEDRITRMRAQLTHIHTNNLTIAQNTQLDQLYEDIHWLLLIAGECGGEDVCTDSSYHIHDSGKLNCMV